jgi:hypothetical protein
VIRLGRTAGRLRDKYSEAKSHRPSRNARRDEVTMRRNHGFCYAKSAGRKASARVAPRASESSTHVAVPWSARERACPAGPTCRRGSTAAAWWPSWAGARGLVGRAHRSWPMRAFYPFSFLSFYLFLLICRIQI